MSKDKEEQASKERILDSSGIKVTRASVQGKNFFDQRMNDALSVKAFIDGKWILLDDKDIDPNSTK